MVQAACSANRNLPASGCLSEFSLPMTHLYTTASLLSNFKGAPAGQGSAIPRGGRRYTGNVAIAGLWPEQSPAPSHDKLHEHEVTHPLEPAFAD